MVAAFLISSLSVSLQAQGTKHRLWNLGGEIDLEKAKQVSGPKLPVASYSSENLRITIYEVGFFNIDAIHVTTGEVVSTRYFDPFVSQTVEFPTYLWPSGEYRISVKDLYGDEVYYLEFSLY